MVLISGMYKQASGIVSKEVVVEHCAFTEPATSNWLLDVKCRSGGSDWKLLSKAYPKAKVEMKTNDISITIPPLQEDTEIAVFGKPGENDLKRMQMYVFGAKPVQGRKWMIYVYICDDTDMAFENLCENEKRKGNKLLTAGAGLFVPNNNKNVSVELNALETGWQIKGSSIKTVESRDVWNSPENATDFPSLSFEIHHVDKTRQSFFCAITASNETKTTAEIMAVFKKEEETDGPHNEYKRFQHKRDVKFCGEHSWWNGKRALNVIALMLVFSIILNGLKMKGNTTTATANAGHALGYYHEQSRPDRDQYVTILKDNMLPRKEDNLNNYSISRSGHKLKADDLTLMHYSQYAFSKNGLPAIMVKQDGFQKVIGQRDVFSAIEADEPNILYKQFGVAGGVKVTTPPAVTGIPTTITDQQT